MLQNENYENIDIDKLLTYKRGLGNRNKKTKQVIVKGVKYNKTYMTRTYYKKNPTQKSTKCNSKMELMYLL